MSIVPDMDVTAVANWYGSSRDGADKIGSELKGYPLVCIPFAGGMSELPHITAAKILVNDMHGHVINLARTMADRTIGPMLYRRLRRDVFSIDDLMSSRNLCRSIETAIAGEGLFAATQWAPTPERQLEWAEAYAVATWMSRGGKSGKKGEFSGALPVRYSPNGGGSAQRFHNWVASIPAWRRVLRRCEFENTDGFVMLDRCHDSPRCAIYVDAPWPEDGDLYVHPFDERKQRRLAKKLATFGGTGRLGDRLGSRVVVRFADHPLIRELYPQPQWTWVTYARRTQANRTFDEVLLINGPSFGKAAA